MNPLETMQHEEIQLWSASLRPKRIQDLLTGNPSSIERNLPWMSLRYYDAITRGSRHCLASYSPGSSNRTRRNAIGYFDNSKENWTSMQQ